MRQITTSSTRQLATAIANQEARDSTTAAIPHLVRATDDEVQVVKDRLDAIVDKSNEIVTGHDRDALTTTQAASIQQAYLDRRATGAYADEPTPVTL